MIKYILCLALLFSFIESKEVMVIGDSITANGMFVEYLKGETGMNFKTYGFTGEGTTHILKKLKNIDVSKYDYLIIEAGINNIDNAARVMSDLQEMFHFAKSENPNIKLIVLTIVPFKGYPTWTPKKQENLEKVNSWLLGKPENVDIVVDIYEPMSVNGFQPHSTDGLHPSKKGHRLMADLIKPHLQDGIRSY